MKIPLGRRETHGLAGAIPLGEFPKVAKLVKSDERYDVYDFKMENLVVSMTLLHNGKETTGHSHDEADEVYLFADGRGEIQLKDKKHKVKKNDIVVIPRGHFHKVFNTSDGDLIFVCVFEKYGERK